MRMHAPHLLAACLGLLAAWAEATTYRISVPGPHTPKNSAIGWDLSSQGDIAAEFFSGHPGTPDQAMLYRQGRRINLAHRAGMTLDYGAARGLNDRGQVVGEARVGANDPISPFLYEHGAMRLLPLPDGAEGGASRINRHGEVVGWTVLPGAADVIGMRYSSQGQWQALPGLRGIGSVALALNDDGVAVGLSVTEGTWSVPVVWRHNVPHRLIANEHMVGTAWDINQPGEIVGAMGPRQGLLHAHLWRDGQAIDLDGDPASSSEARAINDLGQVAGVRSLHGRAGPFVTDGGALQWLDDLIVPEQQGQWQLYNVFRINNAGQILAQGYSPTEGLQPLLLTPVAP